jgi:hypothetical protein
MCQQCVDVVREHWPDLPESEYGTLLLGATAFPFASADVVAEQVADMAKRSGCNVGLACAIADQEIMDAEAAIQSATAGRTPPETENES